MSAKSVSIARPILFGSPFGPPPLSGVEFSIEAAARAERTDLQAVYNEISGPDLERHEATKWDFAVVSHGRGHCREDKRI